MAIAKKNGTRPQSGADIRARHDRARSALTKARAARDPAKIAAAETELEEAAAAYDAWNLSRFERIAEQRTQTAVNALEELIRLVGQKRYRITDQHGQLIVESITESFTALQMAMASAAKRKEQRRPRAPLFTGARA